MSSSSTKPFGSPNRPDGESVRSPYAPKRGRGADPASAADDDPPPPRFLVSSRSEDQDLTDFPESSLQFREAPPVQESHLRRPAASERRSQPYPAGRDEPGDDIDLQRLEESVRRLQREASVNRARADASPMAAAHPEDGRIQRRRAASAETYIDGYRVPPSLQPELLTPPPELKDGNGRMWTLMSMLIASAVAAPIAYYFASGSSSSSDPKLASAETRPAVETLTVTAPVVPARPQYVPAPSPERRNVARAPESAASQVTVVPRRAAVAPPEQSAPPPAPPPPVQNVERTPPPAQRPQPQPHLRTLDPSEIEVLVKQGQQFVAAGDFVTARLVFQRAAEAGNASAALALGASYDPVVLSRLGVRGVDADVGKARTWYQRAKEFGAPDADRRLSALANR